MEVAVFVGISGFVFGLVFGSFLNVLIYRLPREESIMFPASHCPSCKTPIRWYDNVPLLSWLALGGRCRQCREPIGVRYPLVELASALFLMAYLLHFGIAVGIVWYVFTAALLVVTVVDLEHTIIPDVISLPGIPLGLLANMFILSPNWLDGLIDGGIGVLAGGGVLLSVAVGYYLLTKREGMGMGDPKLLAMIGAFCGWKGVIFTMLVASMSGTIIGIAFILIAGKDRRFPIPFGPFLSLGAVAWIWFGSAVLRWYVGY